MHKVMLCDDAIEVIQLLGKSLREERINVTDIVHSGKTCIDLIENGNSPDLLVLDIRMPEMPGYKVAQYLKKTFPAIKILVFSVLTDYDAVKGMISLGVNGFAFKNIKPSELAEIIQKILSGQEYYPPEFLFSTEEIDTIKQQKIPWAEKLTDKEIQATQLLAYDLSRKQVASDMGISASSINKKIERVFKKTNQKTTVGVINFLKKVGMIQ
ncbi:MAG: response regulator [Sediminibacterium sp.]|jgi:DNA-binding NarL/FixJ family response regulator